MDKQQIEKTLRDLTFTDFKWINGPGIKTAAWVRIKCMYGCPGYGNSACPPNVPSVEECRTFFDEYTHAVVLRFNFAAEKDHYPQEYSEKINKKLLELEREIFKQGYFKAFVLKQSCCELCKDCAGTREGCKNAAAARPSPEAFAIDVFDTVRNIGFPIEVVSEAKQFINRYAFLLVE